MSTEGVICYGSPVGVTGVQKVRKFMLDDLALLAIALAVRIAYVLSIRNDPLFDFPQVDARIFWDRALALAGGNGAGGEAVFYKPPLFSWTVSVVIRLFGESAGAARVVLVILSSLAAPMIARLARPIAGVWGARLAGLFAALYAPGLFLGAELLPASTVLLLNLLMLLVLAAAERSGKLHLYGIAGVVLGLSALARPTILLFVPLLLLRYRREWRVGFAMLLAGAAIAIAPATIHNRAGGDRVLVSSNGGLNFYMGNHAGADGRSARAAELPDEPGEAERAAAAIASREAGRKLAPSEVSRYWFRRGVSWAASDPAGWAALTFKRLIFLTNDHEISDNIDFYALAEKSAPLRLMPFHFGILFVLSIVGLKRLLSSREGRLIAIYALAVALPPLLFFVVGRFRLPLLPFLSVGAVFGVMEIVALCRRPARRGIVRAAGALFVAGALVSSDTFDVKADMTWHYHYLVGDAYFRQGKVEEGLASFEESYRRNNQNAATRNALGFLYAETGQKLELAEELVRGALDIDPARRRFYLDSLGRVLYRQGKLDEAAALFEEAIPLFHEEEAYSRGEAVGHLADVREAQRRGEEARDLRKRAGSAQGGG